MLHLTPPPPPPPPRLVEHHGHTVPSLQSMTKIAAEACRAD
jgi:hypothetical protein